MSGDGTLPLSEDAERLLEAVRHKAKGNSPPQVGEWLLAVAETQPSLLEARCPGISMRDLRSMLRESLQRGEGGDPLPTDEVLRLATGQAFAEQSGSVSPRTVVEVLLEKAHAYLVERLGIEVAAPPQAQPSPPVREVVPKPRPRLPEPEPGRMPSFEDVIKMLRGGRRPADLPETPSHPGRTKRPTLERLTTDLTQRALDGKLQTVVGRDREIELVLEILCKVTKRNPALIGPAGVGKTAIVEGVAMRIASGDCPDLLRGARIHLLQPAAIMAGTSNPAEYASTLRDLIEEASSPDVILFIDEFHSVMERGFVMENDLVNLLKPPLARGDIACIAATTDEEYRRIIESDSALSRRFQAIRIAEMNAAQTLTVLRSHRDRLQDQRNVLISDRVLKRIVDYAGDRMPNRHFPDKAVDVLEQSVAHVLVAHRQRVSELDVKDVVERLTGAPADQKEVVENLERALRHKRLLSETHLEELCRQLRVSMAGLDVHPERPNAVILMLGPAAAMATDLSQTLAEALNVSPERIVDIDFGSMTHPADITRLIGAGPSYIGYGEHLPIHDLIQYPWSVLLCRNVDRCFVTIRQALANAIERGSITDGMGRSIRLCDCVVVMTAGHESPSHGEAIGLRSREPDMDGQREVRLVGCEPLLELSTVIVADVPDKKSTMALTTIEEEVLPRLHKRYASRGLDVEWGNGVAEWLLQRFPRETGSFEDKIAALLGDLLLKYVPKTGRAHVRVQAKSDGLKVEILRGRRRRS